MCEEGSWQQIELAQENGDYKKMAALLLPLAENGNEEAQYTLAGLCEAGNGVRKSLKKAFLWYEKGALKNHVLAQYKMGYFYEDFGSNPVRRNLAKAAEWYKLAAMRGNAKAQHRLGSLYYYGNGVEQSTVEAIKWYQKAAIQGLANAQCDMGFVYAHGYGVSRDNAMAIYWYEKAAMQGNDYAQSHLADMFLRGIGTPHDYGKAYALYKILAGKGEMDAMHHVGMFYEFGKGVVQSNRLARYWYKKVLTLKNDPIYERQSLYVQHSLERLALRENGIMLYVRDFAESAPERATDNAAEWLFANGLCLADMQPDYLGMVSPVLLRVDAVFPSLVREKDLPAWQQAFVAHQAGDRLSAFAQMRALAEGGDADAWYLLALMYVDGVVMTATHFQTELALGKVRGKREWLARLHIVQMYYGREKAYAPSCPLEPPSMTRRMLQELAEMDYPPAQNAFGCLQRQMSAHGFMDNGMSSDEMADFWFARAAAQGDAMGQFNFALACERGECGTRDGVQALAFYEKPAAQGFVPAQIRLGVCYRDGNGVPQDKAKARYWLEKAAAQGNATALNALGLWWVRHGDTAQARECFARAAAQGLAVAQNNLGVFVPEAAAQRDCFMQAAAQGDLRAQVNLFLLARRVGDTAQAQQRYERLVLPGDRVAQRAFLRLAAGAGDVWAQFSLGCFYDVNDVFPRDARQAAYWFARAAAGGNARAQYRLGLCYRDGNGVPQDKAKARYWLEKAAAQGNAAAAQALAGLA